MQQINNLPYKVFIKNLSDIKTRFPDHTEIKEISGTFNILFLKDNQFTAVCQDGKFYLITY